MRPHRVPFPEVELPAVEQQRNTQMAAQSLLALRLQFALRIGFLFFGGPPFGEPLDALFGPANIIGRLGNPLAEYMQGVVAVAIRGVKPLSRIDQRRNQSMITVAGRLNQRCRIASRAREVGAEFEQSPSGIGNLVVRHPPSRTAQGQAEQRGASRSVARIHFGPAPYEARDGLPVGEFRCNMQRRAGLVVLVAGIGRNPCEKFAPARLFRNVRVTVEFIQFPEWCHGSIRFSRFSICSYRCPRRVAIVRTSS